MDKLFLLLGIGFVLWTVGDAIVRIIRAGNSGGGKKLQERVEELESDLGEVEQDLEDARKRIEVLETIITDGREDLRRRIDELQG